MSLQKNGSGTVGSGPYYTLYNAATTDGMLFQLNASNNIDFWGLTSNSFTASPVITFTRAGAATFSTNVGVGGASPTYSITAYNASNGTTAAFGGTSRGIRIDNDGTFSSGRSTIFGVDSSFYGSYQPLSIEASALALQAVSGGNVLIGTTTDAGFKLDVAGTGRFIGPNVSNRGQLSIQSNNASNAARASWYYDTTLQGNIGTTSGDFYVEAVNNLQLNAGGNISMGPTSVTSLSTPNGGQLIGIPNAVIVSGIIALGSPYTQNIQIDVVYNNWGGNNVIGLVDMIITLREFANIGGTAFGKVFAVNGGSGATFTSFNTTDVTTSQCTVTATSGGNYTLRITIDPSNVTDRGSFYLVIPNAGGTGSSISSVTISYV
jgi:hypothetical protein